MAFVSFDIYSEGNCIADYMANVGVKIDISLVFIADLSLLRQVRASLKQDQEGIPNFRFRFKKTVIGIAMIWCNSELVGIFMVFSVRCISPSQVGVEYLMDGLGMSS